MGFSDRLKSIFFGEKKDSLDLEIVFSEGKKELYPRSKGEIDKNSPNEYFIFKVAFLTALKDKNFEEAQTDLTAMISSLRTLNKNIVANVNKKKVAELITVVSVVGKTLVGKKTGTDLTKELSSVLIDLREKEDKVFTKRAA